MRVRVLAVLSLSLVAATTGAIRAADPAPPADKPGDPARLTLDRIFTDKEFRGEPSRPIVWLKDGEYTTLRPSGESKDAGDEEPCDLVRVSPDGSVEVLIAAGQLTPPGAAEPLAIDGYEHTDDLDLVLIYADSVKVWRKNTRGDYWTFRRSTGVLRKLGGDAAPASLMFAKLSPDGKQVGYVRGNDLYVEPADGGPIVRLTTDGSEQVINGTFDWVYEEEFACRDGWRWGPDSRRIAYWQLDTRGVKTFTMVDYTSEKYPVLKTFAYPKTGERNSLCRVGVVPAAGGSTTWLAVPGDTRTDYYVPRMEWAESPKELVIRRVNRKQNAIDLMLADADTGAVRTVFTDRDGEWLDVHDDAMAWLDGGKAFTWVSERDGWRQLYAVARDGSVVRRITPGGYDVMEVVFIDEKAGTVYFAASPDNATQQYLYQCPLAGGPATRVSPADRPGWHDYDFAPDGKFAVHTYSNFETPPRSDLVAMPGHKVVHPVNENAELRKAVAALARTPVEFIRAGIGEGVELDGWLMKPTNFDAKKQYPVLFYVYGEPASQAVTDKWGGNNHLWHLFLTQQGYTVGCMDNRGTPVPRGRDWRKAAYRKVGAIAAADQSAAIRGLLKSRPYLDPKRVAAWGWSGGGSLTLNLLFRHPDLFAVGMAVASVPDQRLYDTIYQERYMGLPQDNEADYIAASPITHAAGLAGDLLLVHGTGDDNCHYQGAELLANKLIELGKTFTMMPYPNRSHSVNEGKPTSRHLFGLLTRYLTKHLPPGPQ